MDSAAFDPAAFDLTAQPDLRVDIRQKKRTRRLGMALAQLVDPGAFVGLIGALGAGKTALVQAMVTALDPAIRATSPTYGLLHPYDTDPPIIHADLYRLHTIDELASTGYWDYASDDTTVMCVEWLNRIPGAWPGQGVVIELEADDARRQASLWASPEYRAMLAELALRFDD